MTYEKIPAKQKEDIEDDDGAGSRHMSAHSP